MLAVVLMAWHLRPWRFAFVPAPPALRPGQQRLGRREAVNLRGASGRLTVLQGQLWLTRDGDAEDYVLVAGDSKVVGPREGVVIQSLAAGQGVWVHRVPAGAVAASRAATACDAPAAMRVRSGVRALTSPLSSCLPARRPS
jgi:hypothetical protein